VSGYERALQSIDGSVTAAYWDWSLDSNNMAASPVFDADAFGGNGDSSTKCVGSGLTKGWKVDLRQYVSNRTCLKREFSFSGGFHKFTMDNYYKTYSSFEDFSAVLEAGPHGAIHTGIGEDMVQMSSVGHACPDVRVHPLLPLGGCPSLTHNPPLLFSPPPTTTTTPLDSPTTRSSSCTMALWTRSGPNGSCYVPSSPPTSPTTM
jgi:hypothetical protein